MELSDLNQESLPTKIFSSSGTPVTITAFNSQGMLVLDENGDEGLLPISALASYSLSDPNQNYEVYLNVYPNKIGSRTFATLEKAQEKAGTTCIGQKKVTFNASSLSA